MTSRTVYRIRERLMHARQQHPSCEWNGRGYVYAHDVAREEFAEFSDAVFEEGLDRAEDEALDVIAVLVRFLEREYE